MTATGEKVKVSELTNPIPFTRKCRQKGDRYERNVNDISGALTQIQHKFRKEKTIIEIYIKSRVLTIILYPVARLNPSYIFLLLEIISNV